MKQYKVLNHIAHNGKRYTANDTVEMPEANGQPLVALGYLEPLIGEQQSDDEKSEDKKPAPKRRRKQQATDA